MLAPDGIQKRTVRALAACLFLALSINTSTSLLAIGRPAIIENASIQTQSQRLEAGDVVVNSQEIRGTKYVVAKIIIDESPQRLWPILVNPFEFQGRICHRMKQVQMITDQPGMSVMDCRVGTMFPIPDIDYVVESRYTACKRVDFKRIGGSLRDFKGFWELVPCEGNKTQVTYSMYVDPGYCVPDWLVRQSMRSELPSVLVGLRTRVNSLKHSRGVPEKHNIAASVAGAETL